MTLPGLFLASVSLFQMPREILSNLLEVRVKKYPKVVDFSRTSSPALLIALHTVCIRYSQLKKSFTLYGFALLCDIVSASLRRQLFELS